MQASTNPNDPHELEEYAFIAEAARPVGTFLVVVLMLSADELNPVKVLCSFTYGILCGRHFTYLTAMCLLAIVVHERHRLLYQAIRIFFRSTFNNMFFRSVEIVGLENLPREGPIILTGNHNNQFVDGILLLTNCHREISFMIAQKSYDRPFVGFLARVFHCIPVSRPQDIAKPGAGRVLADGTAKLRGEGTCFMAQVKPGDQLAVKGVEKPFKVKEVTSDTELEVDAEVAPEEGAEGGVTYKVLPKVDQKAMYNEVYRGLKQGKCLGIFPEGGSHDRTDLLPLKAGVALIALDVFSKHHVNVPIVPVGLNYFAGHRFGGRVVVEFGEPIEIPDAVHTQHETDRHGATEALLQIIQNGMRSVIVPAKDYHTLQLIYMVRRFFVPEGVKLDAKKAMDLNRRFALGGHKILQRLKDVDGDLHSGASSPKGDSAGFPADGGSGHGGDDKILADIPQDVVQKIQNTKDEVVNYLVDLKRLGLRDHHVRQIGWWSVSDLVGRLLYLAVTLSVGLIPQMIFNMPVLLIASKLAGTEQKKALKASNVKLAARDVVMSYKVIYVLSFVPVLYVIYGVLLVLFSSLSAHGIVLCLISQPFFAFLGTKASEQGVRAWGDIMPLFTRLLPETRAKQDALPERRANLQKRVKQLIKQVGPLLGDLYNAEEVDWKKEYDYLSKSGFGDFGAWPAAERDDPRAEKKVN